MEGWIKIHRKITKWEWYDDANTFRLFLHLLLMAQHKDTKYRGIELKRSQLLTGRKKLATALKLGERAIRVSLNKLKTTNEITIKATNKYSIITIVNYNAYNDKETCNDQQSDQQKANKRPASDQQMTTCNNVKNVKNEKELKDMRDFDEFWKAIPARNGKKVEKGNTLKKYKTMAVKDRPEILAAARNYANSKQVKDGIGIKDPKRFLNNWKDWKR